MVKHYSHKLRRSSQSPTALIIKNIMTRNWVDWDVREAKGSNLNKG